MIRAIANTFLSSILLVAVGAIAYLHPELVRSAGQIVENEVLVLLGRGPCSFPIPYHIAEFDAGFGITRSDFDADIAKAADNWQKPLGRQLFVEKPSGSLAMNLIYDERQQETQALQKIGVTVKADRASFDQVDAKYKSMLADYNAKLAAFDSDVAAFNAKSDAYSAEVASWNARGGATPSAYNKLQAEQQELKTESTALESRQKDLNDELATVNSLVDARNQLAQELNITVDHYNTSAPDLRQEFEEGVYVQDAAGRHIDIYQYDSNAQLVSVLTHELGHALGLEHNTNPDSVMYYLNEGGNGGQSVLASDIDALKAECHLQ